MLQRRVEVSQRTATLRASEEMAAEIHADSAIERCGVRIRRVRACLESIGECGVVLLAE